MMTEILHCSHPLALERALAVLRAGGLIAFPTDTVYGVASLATDAQAIERLFFAKARDLRKAIPILIGDHTHLEQITTSLPQSARKLSEKFWPGALTIILPRNPALPDVLSREPTVGVRMPNHAFALDLLRQAGPLATTSANLSGGANPQNAHDVLMQLCGRIELVLDGGETPGSVASTVVDCTGEQPTILRQGVLSAETLFAAL